MSYRIREAREKAGLTQEELSLKSGVSRTIISKLESGENPVTLTSTLVKIAEALGMEVSDIFFAPKV